MNILIKHLDILPLVRRQSHSTNEPDNSSSVAKLTPASAEPKQQLNKEEMRLLVKILKAIGHTCEHQYITIQQGITHYQLNNTTLIFDDVSQSDETQTIHLSPLSTMLKDPNQKRPTWEKLKALNHD